MTQGYAKTYRPEALEQEAEQFIANQLIEDPNLRIEIRALPLELRNVEKSCEAPLELSTPSAPPFNRQVTVQLKCPDTINWTQYVHVRIEELVPMVIANKSLARGELITRDVLELVYKPKQFARASYFDNVEPLVGSRSKRTISEGIAIATSQICMVCKGDNVTIEANQATLSIKTTGIALEDGNLGELVSVKNARSGKTLRARVTGVESVEVNL
ncbi:flagellar basal body P-ring formation chaperone FlgA [Pseudoalteromonas fenneropenaei]|uniref:Flagella basal body P-ring formation protein FlgA n=1 Tax=Pseudoalteromonas fenneropenaei TaxID=1737459 RepID=A0ABV7CGT3_9GAMM